MAHKTKHSAFQNTFLVAIGVALAIVIGAPALSGRVDAKDKIGAGRPLTAEESRQVAKLLVEFRRARSAQLGAKVVGQLQTVGPPALRRFDQMLQTLLDGLEKKADALVPREKVVRSPRGELPQSKLELKISGARETLARLRADPELSKDQLQKVGLPALKKLRELHQEQDELKKSTVQKFSRSKIELDRIEQIFAQLSTEWDLTLASKDRPLKLATYREQIDRINKKAAVVTTDELALQEIAKKNARLSGKVDPKVIESVRRTNEIRVLVGLSPLVIDPLLCRAAEDHSRDMKTLGFFSHTSPVAGKTSFFDRAKKAGTTSSGENIYTGSSSPAAAIKAWYLSPGHHKNMLGRGHRRIGLGHHAAFWTMLLGR